MPETVQAPVAAPPVLSPAGRWGRRLATAHMLFSLGRAGYAWVQRKLAETRYSVSVHDVDPIYGPVQAWLLEQMPVDQQQAVIVRTGRRRNEPVPVDSVGGPGRVGRPFEMHFDGQRSQQATIGGQVVTVQIVKDQPAGGSEGDRLQDLIARAWQPSRIVFSCRTVEARDAVLAFLRDLADQLEEGRRFPRVLTASRWGDWALAGHMQPRPLDSVILRDGLLEALVKDLRGFYSSEARYRELGLPWHRGWLLHGPPGSGKSSTAQAIAGALDLDVYYVPLADVRQDADLARMLAGIEARSVLLLEDVDVIHAMRERDDRPEGGITASGLLNALDGVVTPHGLVTVMTTNRLKVLDDAFLRPGRADRIEELGCLDDDQFQRLCKRMLGQPVPEVAVEGRELTAAHVVEVVKRHLDHPERAIDEIRNRWGAPTPAEPRPQHRKDTT